MQTTDLDSRIALVCIVASALVPIGCPADDPIQHALDRGLDYFRANVRETDPSWASLFGYMHRRFGLTATIRGGEPLHGAPPRDERHPMAGIYRRIDDSSAAVDKRRIAELESTVDRITASALHCDRIALPSDWVEILTKASEFGGYALTHSALAGEWTIENGCLSWGDLAATRQRQIVLLVQHVGRFADGMANDPGTPENDLGNAGDGTGMDIWIESIVMLYYLRAGSRVEPQWIEALLAAQRLDGGWPRNARSQRSDPHPTALALWVLLEQLHTDAPPISWIASRTP